MREREERERTVGFEEKKMEGAVEEEEKKRGLSPGARNGVVSFKRNGVVSSKPNDRASASHGRHAV